MRIAAILFCFMLFPFFAGLCQVIQKGRATLMSSGKKGVSGVEILISGAAPAVSDGNGEFRLVFSRQKAGESFTVISIAKSGFEIVNARDLDSRTLSAERELSIVLAPCGQLEESRRKFYNIGANVYQQRYQKGLDDLMRLKAENSIDQQNYSTRMAELSAEYKNAREKLEFYANKFACMNKDELSELDRNALSLLEKGDVDGAIKIYEESGILEQFLEKVAIRDTARMNIIDYKEVLLRQIKLYRQQNDSLSAAKANKIINKVLQRWPDDEDFNKMK